MTTKHARTRNRVRRRIWSSDRGLDGIIFVAWSVAPVSGLDPLRHRCWSGKMEV